MERVEVHYYDRPGPDNTDDVVATAAARAKALGIKQVVVATSHGSTALKAREALPKDVRVIAVTHSASYHREGWTPTPEERERMARAGLQILTTMHALANDISEAMCGEAWPPNRIVCETLSCFSQGMKVAVEISVMAAEAGLLDMRSEVIAIGGTDKGADTAVVLRPTYARDFRQFKVHEILAMPR